MRTKVAKLAILICLFGFYYGAQGQVLAEKKIEPSQKLYDFHLNKMKSNKTAAWVALGGGAAMLIGGIAVNLSENIFDDSSEGLVMAGVGFAATLASIPLFKAARTHKNKAEIQLQNGAVGFNNEFNYSAISVSFSF